MHLCTLLSEDALHVLKIWSLSYRTVQYGARRVFNVWINVRVGDSQTEDGDHSVLPQSSLGYNGSAILGRDYREPLEVQCWSSLKGVIWQITIFILQPMARMRYNGFFFFWMVLWIIFPLILELHHMAAWIIYPLSQRHMRWSLFLLPITCAWARQPNPPCRFNPTWSSLLRETLQ